MTGQGSTAAPQRSDSAAAPQRSDSSAPQRSDSSAPQRSDSTSAPQRLDLQVDGVFDEEEARHLTSLLARFAPRQRVRVYFHHVRQFHDRVVAILARELSAPYGRNIELVGLSQHHLRVFRYMTGSLP